MERTNRYPVVPADFSPRRAEAEFYESIAGEPRPVPSPPLLRHFPSAPLRVHSQTSSVSRLIPRKEYELDRARRAVQTVAAVRREARQKPVKTAHFYQPSYGEQQRIKNRIRRIMKAGANKWKDDTVKVVNEVCEKKRKADAEQLRLMRLEMDEKEGRDVPLRVVSKALKEKKGKEASLARLEAERKKFDDDLFGELGPGEGTYAFKQAIWSPTKPKSAFRVKVEAELAAREAEDEVRLGLEKVRKHEMKEQQRRKPTALELSNKVFIGRITRMTKKVNHKKRHDPDSTADSLFMDMSEGENEVVMNDVIKIEG